MSSSCCPTHRLEIAAKSSGAGEATILRPVRVLLLVVLAESQSDASAQLTQEVNGQ